MVCGADQSLHIELVYAFVAHGVNEPPFEKADCFLETNVGNHLLLTAPRATVLALVSTIMSRCGSGIRMIGRLA